MKDRKQKSLTKVAGQLMIWRSGFGCDLVEYIKDSETQYYSCKVKMLTGRFNGMEGTFEEWRLRDTTKEIYERYSNKHF